MCPEEFSLTGSTPRGARIIKKILKKLQRTVKIYLRFFFICNYFSHYHLNNILIPRLERILMFWSQNDTGDSFTNLVKLAQTSLSQIRSAFNSTKFCFLTRSDSVKFPNRLDRLGSFFFFFGVRDLAAFWTISGVSKFLI